ncbi:MAG: MXAN_2562 family outer membrane beta-barrel protein [Myxococcales bacterium]|nr:MXAN_2562 family outer membrane beta-barrel protein [Myxococcales bacterium]
MKTFASALVLMTVIGVSPDLARAEDVSYASKESWSPEGYLLSLGIGAYRPDPGSSAFDVVYSGNGPLLLPEFDFFIYRIPFLGPLGIGIAGGWAGYKGTACLASSPPGTCVPSSDGAKFSLFPINAMVVLRIDALARRTPVPFVFSGKVGYNTVFFKETVGSGKGTGRSHGFGWAAQLALELNFINPRRANALDEDWGINSSFFFFELAGSDANNRAPVGDKLYFTGGLGLTF